MVVREGASPAEIHSYKQTLLKQLASSTLLLNIATLGRWLLFVQASAETLRPRRFLGSTSFSWGLPLTCKSSAYTFLPVLSCSGASRLEMVGGGRKFCLPYMGMKLSGLLEEYEVRKSSEVRPRRASVPPNEGAGCAPSARPDNPSACPWPAPASGFQMKSGIATPWVLHFKCQAPKYPLKCRQMNC